MYMYSVRGNDLTCPTSRKVKYRMQIVFLYSIGIYYKMYHIAENKL